MDSDWDEVSRIAVPPSGPHVLPTVASTIAFDDTQELLWTGNEFVRLRPLVPILEYMRHRSASARLIY